MDNQNLISTELQIDSFGQAQLSQTSKWAKFLSILGFVSSAFLVLVALAFPSYMEAGDMGLDIDRSGIGAMISFMYIIAAVINFIMAFFLYKYAVAMQKALTTANQDQLNLAFKNHKMVYKIIGILTIIYLSFVLLSIVFGLIGAAIS